MVTEPKPCTRAQTHPPAETAGESPARATGHAGRVRRIWVRLVAIRSWLLLVAGLLWLLLVAAHRVVSGRAWWWAPVDAVPPLTFAMVPLALFALVWLAHPPRWRLTVAPAFAFVLGVAISGINLATLWNEPPPAPPGAITLVSWNTEFWDQDLSSGGHRDTDDFYRFLRGLDADVYLLHEYAHLDASQPDLFAQTTRINQMARLRATFPAYQIAIAGKNVTLSRLPIVGSAGLDSSPWLPADLRSVPAPLRDRPEFYTVQVLRTDIMVGGRVVSFYNAHLDQPPVQMALVHAAARQRDRFNDAKRRASLAALRTDVAGNPYPAVLGGDLNTSPSMGLRRLLPDRLHDRSSVLSSLYPTSWKVGGLDLWRIDWLMTTSAVVVHRYDLLDPAGLSDHRAQRAVLSVHA